MLEITILQNFFLILLRSTALQRFERFVSRLVIPRKRKAATAFPSYQSPQDYPQFRKQHVTRVTGATLSRLKK